MEPIEPAARVRRAAAEVEAAVRFARADRGEHPPRRQGPRRRARPRVVALLAEGHILVEDYPGVGKTALARALSRTLDCQFARVQCTADLLPADIVGANVYNQREQRFEFRPGPIFANVVLVDEINRASPKTQSGLLECMQERHVTVDVHSHELALPFLVFATQNPVEYEGTYPLPEAQVDRFMVRLSLGYPDAEAEAGMLAGHEGGDRVLDLEAVVDRAEVLDAQDAARRVHASRALRDYIVALLRHTRDDHARGARRLAARRPDAAARRQGARARSSGRDHALPDDVQALAPAGARAPDHARARGGGRRRARRSSPTRSRRRRRSRGGGRALRPRLRGARAPAAARRRHVRRRAALRHRRRAAAARRRLGGLDRPRRLGRADPPHGRQAQRDRGGAAAGAHRGHARGRLPLPPGWIDEPLLPRAGAGSAPGAAARACASRSRSARRGRRVLAPPALVLRDPFGLAQRVVRGAHADEVLVLPRRPAGARHRRRRRRRQPAHARAALIAAAETRDRRPARAPRGLARVAHPLAERRARRRPDGAQADLRGRLAAARRARPARAGVARRARRGGARGRLAHRALRQRGPAAGCCCPATAARSIVEPDLLAWPQAHVRLALIDDRTGPALAAAQNRRGLVVFVAARVVDRAAARPRAARPAAACSWSRARSPAAAPCSRSRAATASWPGGPAAPP